MPCLEKILEKIRSYNPEEDLEPVRKAYEFSARIHEGKFHHPGESALEHCVEVALVLARLKMDIPTIISGLLHDSLEKDLSTIDELKSAFGDEVGELVNSLTKISKMFFRTSEERQAENFRKMLLALARDIRVILVKLADRLHTIRTLNSQPKEKQIKIARETLAIYAPMANRLGISWLKSELEDISFKYLKPEIYNELAEKIAKEQKEREKYIEDVRKNISEKLEEHGIDGDISGRLKHLYSTYLKMDRQGVDFEQIFDLIAFRIIVNNVRECYAVLGIIHSAWKPIPGRFKDYVAMPKANMYQSLHTTVIGPYGERMEVQIRTEDMHRIAEEGIAAHWKYKEGAGVAVASGSDDKRFRWLRQLLEWRQELKDYQDFSDSTKVDLFPEEVYVFTPNGDVKELPRGSCPIDFAYSIHSDIGHRCVGARVNGKLVPLKTQLHNGDIVEVLTASNQTPGKDWLKFVRTSKARNKIRHWVKTEQREKSIELARDLLEKDFRKYGFSLNRVLASKDFAFAVEDLGFHTADDLLAAVGYGKLSAKQVLSRIVPQEKLKPPKTGRITKVLDKIRKKPSSAIKIHGVEDIMVRFAKCCNPLPGDPIVGFITRGRGVTVHAVNCPHILTADPERRVEVEWDMKKKATRPAKICAYCVDQKGVLAGITAAITNCEANIISANVHSTVDRKGVNTFQVDVQDLEHLNRVINAVQKVKGVYKVERMRN